MVEHKRQFNDRSGGRSVSLATRVNHLAAQGPVPPVAGPNPRPGRSRLATGSGGFQWLFSRIGALGGLTLHGSVMERPETLGRMGSLELRLARTAADVRRAQRLRYDIFY